MNNKLNINNECNSREDQSTQSECDSGNLDDDESCVIDALNDPVIAFHYYHPVAFRIVFISMLVMCFVIAFIFAYSDFFSNRKSQVTQINHYQKYGTKTDSDNQIIVNGIRYRICPDDKSISGNNSNPQSGSTKRSYNTTNDGNDSDYFLGIHFIFWPLIIIVLHIGALTLGGFLVVYFTKKKNL